MREQPVSSSFRIMIAALAITACLPGWVGAQPAATEIYWVESPSSDLFRANIDGSNVELIRNLGPGGVSGLDIRGGKIYFVDSTNTSIHRMDLDGTDLETLFDLGVGLYAHTVRADLSGGRVYWGEFNALVRADLGQCSVIEDVTPAGMGSGGGIIIDRPNARLFAGPNIVLADLDGDNAQTLTTGPTSWADYDVDFVNETIWFYSYPHIGRVNTDGTGFDPQHFSLSPPFTGSVKRVELDAPADRLYYTRNGNLSPGDEGIFYVDLATFTETQVYALPHNTEMSEFTLFRPDAADACTTGATACTGQIPGVEFATVACPAVGSEPAGDARCVQSGIGGDLSCELQCSLTEIDALYGVPSFDSGPIALGDDYKCGQSAIKAATKLAVGQGKCQAKELKARLKGKNSPLAECNARATEKYQSSLDKAAAKIPGCNPECFLGYAHAPSLVQDLVDIATTAGRFCPATDCTFVCSGDGVTSCVSDQDCDGGGEPLSNGTCSQSVCAVQ